MSIVQNGLSVTGLHGARARSAAQREFSILGTIRAGWRPHGRLPPAGGRLASYTVTAVVDGAGRAPLVCGRPRWSDADQMRYWV